MTPVLLVAMLAPAQVDAEACRSVRQTEALAVREGFGRSPVLDALKARYCGAQPQQAVAQDPCYDLWLMTELARVAGSDKALEIDQMRAVSCAAGHLAGGARWSSGLQVASSTGTLRYPHGVSAKSSTGTWRYPNGVAARTSSGTWRYPNGVRARSSRGRWSDPRGRSYRSVTEMLINVCGPGACVAALDEIQDWEGEARVVGLLRIVWDAHQARRP